jgi:dTDP-4-amino-4,6-dideoxygalactose transaminase
VLAAELAEVPGLELREPAPGAGHAYYKYYAFIDPSRLRPEWTRERVVEAINAEGIPCISGSCSEIYLEKAFDGTGLRPAAPLPVARRLGETSLMFMVHPTLSRQDIVDTAAAIRKVMQAAAPR